MTHNLHGLSPRLEGIEGLNNEDRHQLADLLRHWLRFMPHLVELNLCKLLTSLGVVEPTKHGTYRTTWVWEHVQERKRDAYGLLWWLEQRYRHPGDVMDLACSIWCRIGSFRGIVWEDPTHTYRRLLRLSDPTWERLRGCPTPNPTLVRVMTICGGPVPWTLEQIQAWRDEVSKRVLIRDGGIIGVNDRVPVEPAVEWMADPRVDDAMWQAKIREEHRRQLLLEAARELNPHMRSK